MTNTDFFVGGGPRVIRKILGPSLIPLGNFLVTAHGVSRLTRIVKQIADAYAGGRLVSMLEGGYADSPRDPGVAGSQETFSGLSQCAENHIKTLMTGEVQPETAYYSGSFTIGVRSKRPWSGPALQNGRIVGLLPDDGPHVITVCDCGGKTIRTMIASGTEADIAIKEIAAGRYIVSIHGRKKTTVLSIAK
jgi:hypothetical protein